MNQQRSLIALFTGVAALALLSFIAMGWDFKDTTYHFTGNDGYRTDTVPGKNKARDKKIRDLDDALAELERAQTELDDVHLKTDIEKMKKEMAEAMKQLNAEKIRMEVEQSLRAVDIEKIEKEIRGAMVKVEEELASVDMDKVKMEIKESLAKVDMEKMKKEIEKVKEIELKNLDKEMEKARKEIEEIHPKLEAELKKANVELEKAKKELKELKEFVDGLDRDDLIDKDKEYKIELKKGKLIINGKEQSQEIYNKYRKYLDGKKDFKIEKTDDNFNINMDNDGVIIL